MEARKPERDLTATLHLGVRGVVSDSESHQLSQILEKLSEAERATVAQLNGEHAMLIAYRGANKGSRFLISSLGVSIGRAPENDIFLDDVTVSRKHANISLSKNGDFVVEDLGSLNGTYVNDLSKTNATLSMGDELQIGKFHLLFLKGGNR